MTYSFNKATVYCIGTKHIHEEIYNNNDLNTAVSKVSYLFMGMKRIARAEGSSLAYYYSDHLGSTRIVKKGESVVIVSTHHLGLTLVKRVLRDISLLGKKMMVQQGCITRYYDSEVGRFVFLLLMH